MIFHGPPRTALTLNGLGAATPSDAVKRLQTSLTQLAALTAQPGLNPGPITGIVDHRTATSTTLAVSFIGPRIPNKVAAAAITALTLVIPFTPDLPKLITNSADEISSAINIVIATTPAAFPATVSVGLPWWQTPEGRGGLLAAAGLLLTILVMKKYRSVPEAL